MFCLICSFFTLVGFLAVCSYLYDNLKTPLTLARIKFQEIFGDRKPLRLAERYGKWAAITGATDGIGKEYARELARRGLNVVLISRTEAKLKKVAEEIKNEFGVETKIIVADFTAGKSIYEHIERELEELPVGILINNVGVYISHYGILSTFSTEEIWNIINTNIAPVTLLSRLFLQRMQNASIKGVIVNVSSGTESIVMPYASLYASSKAYTRHLTLCLQTEAAPHGISVQLVSPYLVVTNMTADLPDKVKKSRFAANVKAFGRYAVDKIGKVDETSGYFWHGVQTAITKLIPWRVRAVTSLHFLKNVMKTPIQE